jgi:hypothetical protein
MREAATAKEHGGDERRGGGKGRGKGAEVRREVMVRGPVVGEYTAYGVCQVLIGREEAREAEKCTVEFWFGKKGLDSHFCAAMEERKRSLRQF